MSEKIETSLERGLQVYNTQLDTTQNTACYSILAYGLLSWYSTHPLFLCVFVCV